MPSSFLQLTNKVLRRLHEVELTSSNFSSARGVHAVCRDAVCDAVASINAHCFEWPFNAYEHTQNLIPGTNEYGWPLHYKTADWSSFQIHYQGNRYQTLQKINRDQWYFRYRDLDYEAGVAGRDMPRMVFESHGRGFGVTPAPNESYDLTFRYYITPPKMELPDDETTIPVEWEWVIVQAAMYHGNLFKEDEGAADRADMQYQKNLQSMRTLLVNKDDQMISTQITQGRYTAGGLVI